MKHLERTDFSLFQRESNDVRPLYCYRLFRPSGCLSVTLVIPDARFLVVSLGVQRTSAPNYCIKCRYTCRCRKRKFDQ